MGLVRYTVHFNKQQSNSCFTCSKEGRKKTPCQPAFRLRYTEATRILTGKRQQESFNIHSVVMSEVTSYECFHLFLWKAVVWMVPWGSPPGQPTFLLCEESHLMRINTCVWSWLQIFHQKLKRRPLLLHLVFFLAFMVPTSSISEKFMIIWCRGIKKTQNVSGRFKS